MIRRPGAWFFAFLLTGFLGCSSSDAPEDNSDPKVQNTDPKNEAEDPDAIAAYDKGLAAESAGDYAAAREHFIQARVHQPKFRDTDERLDSLGAILMAQQSYDEAQTDGDPSQQASGAVALANALRERPSNARNLKRSEALFSEAAEKDPDNADAHYGMALVAAERGDFIASMEACNQTLERNPDHSGAHYQIAFLSRVMADGDKDVALEHAEMAVERAGEPQAHYYEMLAVCQHATGATEDAVASITKACEISDKPRYKARLEAWAPPTSAPADEPPADEPPADEPPADEPPADEPPADEPPADAPPADEPPADEPPADEPPADEPPADEPPADEPPADAPPADEPPADEPPADEPPADEPMPGMDD